MATLFRSRDLSGVCPVAREGGPYPGPVDKCPCGNPRCQAEIIPLSAWEATLFYHGTTIKRVAILACGAALVLVLLLLFRKDPDAEKLQKLQADQAAMESRLANLASQPSTLATRPEETLRQMVARAQELSGKAARALEAHQIGDARGILQSLETMPKQAQAAMAPPAISADENTHNAEAQQLLQDLQQVEDTTEDLLQKVQRKPRIKEPAEALAIDVANDLSHAQKLVRKRPKGDSSVDLTSLVAQINDALAKTRHAVEGYVPLREPPKRPFPPEEATSRIVATADLAENLVLPILKARSQGESVAGEDKTWYYQSKPGSQPQERIVVRTGELPYHDLLAGTADLVVSDVRPSGEEKSQFAASHPGNALESRSFSEVVALDALTLLANPNSTVNEITEEEAARSRWIGGPEKSPEHLTASRFGFQISQVAEHPAEAVLTGPQLRGLGLWHKEGANIRALRLAYKAGPGTQALKASPFTIATEDYKFSVRIIATQSPKSRPEALSLVQFMTSAPGQQIIAQHGYVDLGLRPVGGDVDPRILAILARALNVSEIKGAFRLSINFHFETNEDALDLKAMADLERLPIEIARDYPTARVVILGFADSTGGPKINVPLSVNRAKRVTEPLLHSRVKAVPTGLGDVLPVDTNDTVEGRARNRRAEVWVVP